MTVNGVLRETTSDEITQVLGLYPQAFPEEDLRPVVSALVKGAHETLSLAAFDGNALVAHVLFTICGTEEGDHSAALLAPLGVVPSHQRKGLGSALVQAGLDALEKKGVKQVFVLGDPAYYGRFGFLPERSVLAPYEIPDAWADAWQSLQLAGRPPLGAGRLVLPEQWMDPALWAS